MKISYKPYELKLRYPFAISRHTYYTQPGVVIMLVYEGHTGLGEATSNPYYGVTTETLMATFATIQDRLKNYNFTTPDRLWDDFADFLDVNSFALAALNNASWDLYGKLSGKHVSDLFTLSNAAQIPMTSYTIGIASIDEILRKIDDFPWPLYKIKLGTADDLTIMKSIRAHTTAGLRVDANCAWNAEKTISLSGLFKDLNVEYIEQPLPAGHPDQVDIFTSTKLPLFADESCCIEADVAACTGSFHGINIKLLKCGGLSPAIRMVQAARKLGLGIMIGCMSESGIGVSAAATLLPFADYVDLDGPLLLADGYTYGLDYQDGYLKTNKSPGLGLLGTDKLNELYKLK